MSEENQGLFLDRTKNKVWQSDAATSVLVEWCGARPMAQCAELCLHVHGTAKGAGPGKNTQGPPNPHKECELSLCF